MLIIWQGVLHEFGVVKVGVQGILILLLWLFLGFLSLLGLTLWPAFLGRLIALPEPLLTLRILRI